MADKSYSRDMAISELQRLIDSRKTPPKDKPALIDKLRELEGGWLPNSYAKRVEELEEKVAALMKRVEIGE